MNPLIVLEKKYINQYNFGSAVLIAFLKEKGGVYNGSLSSLSEELGIMSREGIFKAEKKLERLGIIKADRSKYKEYRYILNESMLESKDNECIKEQKTKQEIPEKNTGQHIIPIEVRLLVDKIQEIREKKKKKTQ